MVLVLVWCWYWCGVGVVLVRCWCGVGVVLMWCGVIMVCYVLFVGYVFSWILLTLYLTVIMDVLVSVCRLRLVVDSIDTTSHSNHGCVRFCL